jgi:hypothetical protein
MCLSILPEISFVYFRLTFYSTLYPYLRCKACSHRATPTHRLRHKRVHRLRHLELTLYRVQQRRAYRFRPFRLFRLFRVGACGARRMLSHHGVDVRVVDTEFLLLDFSRPGQPFVFAPGGHSVLHTPRAQLHPFLVEGEEAVCRVALHQGEESRRGKQ